MIIGLQIATLVVLTVLVVETFYYFSRDRRWTIEVPKGATLVLTSKCKMEEFVAINLHGGSMVIGGRDEPIMSFEVDVEPPTGWDGTCADEKDFE